MNSDGGSESKPQRKWSQSRVRISKKSNIFSLRKRKEKARVGDIALGKRLASFNVRFPALQKIKKKGKGHLKGSGRGSKSSVHPLSNSPGGVQLVAPPQGLTSSSLSLPRVSIWLLRVLSIMDSFSMRMSYLLLLKEIPVSHLLVT